MAQESPSIDSVFDFLYVDHVRIATLLAQLDNYGHLESIKVGDESATKTRTGGSAGLPFTLKGTVDRESGATEKAERSYNPLWLHARQFLDIFEELGFVNRTLAGAELGSLVVASGSLTINDPRFLKPLWRSIMGAVAGDIEMPNFAPATPPGMSRQQRRALARAGQASSVPPAAEGKANALGDVISTFLENMPHAVRGRLKCEDERLWFMLVPERMSLSPEEIVLKHGTRVPGEWHVAGLIDALPGDQDPDEEGHGPFLDAMSGATTALREQMGRPASDYGITPLLIFRKTTSSNYGALVPA